VPALIAGELAAARRLRGRPFDVDPALAATGRGFADALSPAELAGLDAGAGHWIGADSLVLPDWHSALGLGRDYRDVVSLSAGWSGEVEAVPGSIAPTVALAFQAAHGCEVALELLYDAETDRLCSLVVRGCDGGAFSNLSLHCAVSARYVVLPVFHTHPALTNEIGLRKASRADYQALRRLRHRLGGGPVGERVYFPDGRCTDYGLTGSGRPFDLSCGSGLCSLLSFRLLA
jgi:hypothetical protein